MRDQSASLVERFEALAAPLENKVYATCYHMVGNREDALDCAQDAMLRAFRAFSSFRGDAKFSTWMDRIAVNTCLDFLRGRKKVVSLDAMREEGTDLPDTAAGAYARLESKERLGLLREALQKLPDGLRAILILRELRGMRYDEIGQALCLPEGTVKSRINRARGKLIALLRKDAELFSFSSVNKSERRQNP